MYIKSSNRKLQPNILLRFFFIVTLLVSIKFFSFLGIGKTTIQIIEIFILMILVFLCIISTKKIGTRFSNSFYFIIFLTFIASIPANIYHNQDFYLSFWISRSVLYFLIYRFLHLYGFDYKYVFKVLLYIGFSWSIIMIIQSFTFPTYWFLKTSEFEIADLLSRARGSIIRINIDDVRYGVLFLLFAVGNILSHFNLKRLLLVLIGFYAIYLTGTRQIIFTCLFLSLVWVIFHNKNNFSKFIFRFIFISVVIIFSYSSILSVLQPLIEKSFEDFNDDYIRILSANFYFFDFWPKSNPLLAYLFGNGWEHGSSPYGQKIFYIIDRYRFYRGDVGLIGALNKFGLFYIISIIYFIIKVLKFPYQKKDKFVKYFFIFLCLTYFTGSNFFEKSSVIPFLACLTFYLDKLEINATRNITTLNK